MTPYSFTSESVNEITTPRNVRDVE